MSEEHYYRCKQAAAFGAQMAKNAGVLDAVLRGLGGAPQQQPQKPPAMTAPPITPKPTVYTKRPTPKPAAQPAAQPAAKPAATPPARPAWDVAGPNSTMPLLDNLIEQRRRAQLRR